MKEHHQRSINNFVRFLQQDTNFRAIIIAGSVAKGIARDDSDIDAYLVVTDKEFERRSAEQNLSYFNQDVCDYPGGYIDGKIICYDFLVKAAEKGSEPTRASFQGAYAAYSTIPDLQQLLDRIPVFPEERREANLKDFYAQLLLYGNYFAVKAWEQDNAYLLTQSLSQVALSAGRIVLAYNRQLFPCHKSLMRAVEAAETKPEQFVQKTNDLLKEPTRGKLKAYLDMMSVFYDCGISMSQAVSMFVQNNEWNWLEPATPLMDR